MYSIKGENITNYRIPTFHFDFVHQLMKPRRSAALSFDPIDAQFALNPRARARRPFAVHKAPRPTRVAPRNGTSEMRMAGELAVRSNKKYNEYKRYMDPIRFI